MTRTDISTSTKINEAALSKTLTELVECDFISLFQPFLNKKKDAIYKLTDFYSLFYLKFIQPNKGAGSKIWEHLSKQATYTAWSGYAFESLCRRHLAQMKRALGIAGVQTEQSTWSHVGSAKELGAQVDLLIDRRDDCIHLCEMKFAHGEFVIDKRYAERLRERKETFRRVTRTRKTLLITLVTTFDLFE